MKHQFKVGERVEVYRHNSAVTCIAEHYRMKGCKGTIVRINYEIDWAELHYDNSIPNFAVPCSYLKRI